MDDTALVKWLAEQNCPRCETRPVEFRLSDSYPLTDSPGWVHEATCAACGMRSTVEERPTGTFRWRPLT